MNETQKRIKEYVKRLPGLKAKVMTAAMLLMVAAIMVTSASFAWVTLSRAPEITNVSTTISGNGNLEVALAKPDGTEPAESTARDGSLPILERNLTWGNLINLTDPAYGLDHLALRPARLNDGELTTSPLFGAQYGNDGRVTKLDPNFAYSTWQELVEGSGEFGFKVSDDYGVRAISSVMINAVGNEKIYYAMLEETKTLNLNAATTYANLANNEEYMGALATLMGTFMTAKFDSSADPIVYSDDIKSVYDLHVAFLGVLDLEAEALAGLCNLETFIETGTRPSQSETVTKEDIISGTNDLSDFAISNINYTYDATMSILDGYRKDRGLMETNKTQLEGLKDQGDLTWKESKINEIVTNLVNVNECTVDDTPIKNIGKSAAAGLVLQGNTLHKAVITNGVLYNFEHRTGGTLVAKNMTISATAMGFNARLRSDITTNAPKHPHLFNKTLDTIEEDNTGNFSGVKAAKDTYGLAVDVWVRTNADASFLKLEGNVLTEESDPIQAVGTDNEGNLVNIYTYTYTETLETEEGTVSQPVTIDVYQKKDEEGNVVWYNANTHGVEQIDEGTTPVLKTIIEEYVIGYEGENRIWDDSAMLTADSTTQGAGSCYVFYADRPEDQARSLNLLQSMKVAFVDKDGTLLATAEMDTEHFYAENGRVTVPLVLDSDSNSLGLDENGEEQRYITALEKNVAKRITALVYLDGLKLTNQEVLAAAEIQGQLNIQFGSTHDLEHAEDETLRNAERKVTATVTPTEHNYEKGETADMKSTVEVTVEGDQPSSLTGFFLRAINNTQGSREEKMTFTDSDGDGKWTAEYNFKYPGNYVLRTVNLDGSEYKLADPPKVTIIGFTIKNISCDQCSGAANYARAITADNFYDISVRMEFASNDASRMPDTVVVQFMHDEMGSVVNVPMQYNTTKAEWTGDATLLNSGTYVMRYVLLDGQPQELLEGQQATIDLSLGMRAEVSSSTPTTIQHDFENPVPINFRVKILDNNGAELKGLDDVELFYAMQGNEGIKAKGLVPMLKWNAAANYYEGAFPAKPGIFKFGSVSLGDDVINKATESPVFTIIPPDPPEYVGYELDTTHVNLTDPVQPTATVTLRYASAASARAVFGYDANGNGKLDEDEEYYNTPIVKEGEPPREVGDFTPPYDTDDGEDGLATFAFGVPCGTDGKMDGEWTLLRVELIDVYDADGILYSKDETNPDNTKVLVIDEIPETAVVDVTTASLKLTKESESIVFGADASGKANGAFLSSYTVGTNQFGIQFADPQNSSVILDNSKLNLEKITATFTYDAATVSSYGGYSASGSTNIAPKEFKDVLLTYNSATKTWNLAEPLALKSVDGQTYTYAGEYDLTQITVWRNSVPYVYSWDEKKEPEQTGNTVENPTLIEVYSKQPTVKITAVTPATGSAYAYDEQNPNATDTYELIRSGLLRDIIWTRSKKHKETAVSEKTDYSAKVYYQCLHTGEPTWNAGNYLGWIYGHVYHRYSQPTVTITLSELTNFAKAELPFTGGNEGLYTSSGKGNFSWTTNVDSKMYVGKYTNRNNRADDEKTPTGTITASNLIVTGKDNNTYQFTVPTITIINEY